MADEVIPENEAVQTAEENSTSQEQVPTPDPAPPETTEAPADQTAEQKTEWNRDRQKRDQEAASERRRQEAEEFAQLKQSVQLLTQIVASNKVTPAQQEQAKDEVEEIQKLNNEHVTLITQAEGLIDTDPLESSKLYAKAAKVAAQANTRNLELTKTMRDQIKHRDAQDATTAAERQEWNKWLKSNPDVGFESAVKLRDESISQAVEELQRTGKPFSAELLNFRMEQIFNEKLPTIKKSKTPVITPTPTPTATKSGSTTPPGTQVTPSSTGVRAMPNKASGAADFLHGLLVKPVKKPG